MASQAHTQGLYNHTGQTSLGETSQHQPEIDKIQANVFFDGTRNNYYNVSTEDKAVRSKYAGGQTSYDNALSNIARMWESLDKDPDNPDPAAYVEGMGTSKEQADTFEGYVWGTGETGIEARAQQAFQQVIAQVKKKRRGSPPGMLELNLYGFSRGALRRGRWLPRRHRTARGTRGA